MGRTALVLGVLSVACVLLVASNPSVVRYANRGQYNPSLSSALARVRGRIGSPAPELTFRFISDDSRHLLSEFQGKVVLLSVWTTSCGPCRAEMPALTSLQKLHGVDRIAVITLASESRERIRRSTKKGGLLLPPFSSYSNRMDWVPNLAWPLTIVIDSHGAIREVSLGERSQAQLDGAVRRYL
jgi:thiol-disulfide isomerase/thioredoxin